MVKRVPSSPLLSDQLFYSNLGKRRSHSGSINQHYNYLWPPDHRLPFPSPARSYAQTQYCEMNSQFMSHPLKYLYSSSVKTFSSHVHNFSRTMTIWWIFPLRSNQMCCVKERLAIGCRQVAFIHSCWWERLNPSGNTRWMLSEHSD